MVPIQRSPYMSGGEFHEALLKQVLDTYPDLQDFGFGAFDSIRKTTPQIAQEIADGRRVMLESRSLRQFDAASRWLAQFKKLKHVNPRGTSYGLKHVAEHSIDYVTNGIFIAAAISVGFTVKRVTPDSPNAWFNISSAAWESGR